MASIVSTGIGSGLDVGGLVQQLVAAEAEPAEARFARKEAGVLAKISAYSSIKSALSDFQSALEAVEDRDALLGRTVQYTDNEFFSITASSDASPASFELDIVQQAVGQKLSSAAFVDRTSVVGYGDLAISTGNDAFVVTIDQEAATLTDIQNAINNASDNESVRATVVSTDSGAYLLLSSLETGEVNEISITSSGGDGGLSVLEYDSATATGALSEIRAAADAIIEIDGLQVTSSGNQISDAIDGVTINITGQDPGVVRQVEVDYDREALQTKVQSFVDAYNELVDQFDAQTGFEQESGIAGSLLGDGTLRTIRSQLRREFSEALSDQSVTLRNLRDIGISVGVDGKLSVDDTSLENSVAEHFLAIGTLFTADDGIAVRLAERIEQALQSDGALEVRSAGLQSTIDDINSQREALNERLVSLEARLLRQFNALDSLVSQLSNTSDFLAQQLSALPGTRSGGS